MPAGFRCSSTKRPRKEKPRARASPARRLPVSESSKLATIREKVMRGDRLGFDDGIALFLEPDLLAVGQLANEVREKRHGDRTYFNRNMRIEVTNVCVAS